MNIKELNNGERDNHNKGPLKSYFGWNHSPDWSWITFEPCRMCLKACLAASLTSCHKNSPPLYLLLTHPPEEWRLNKIKLPDCALAASLHGYGKCSLTHEGFCLKTRFKNKILTHSAHQIKNKCFIRTKLNKLHRRIKGIVQHFGKKLNLIFLGAHSDYWAHSHIETS